MYTYAGERLGGLMVAEKAGCPHHWIIESAAGPTSKGVCQHCGESREFENAPQVETWLQQQARQRRERETDAEAEDEADSEEEEKP